MSNNICANQIIFDNSTSRATIRKALQKCFKNYDDLWLANRVRRLEEAEIRFHDRIEEIEGQNRQLSLIVNELNNKVINITAENERIRTEMQNITDDNEEMRLNFGNLAKENGELNSIIKNQGVEFERFRNETREEFKKQAEALQRLENELLIWTSRPCSCQ